MFGNISFGRNYFPLLVGGLCLLSFFLLGFLVLQFPDNFLDRTNFFSEAALPYPWLGNLLKLVSFFGETLVALLLLLLLSLFFFFTKYPIKLPTIVGLILFSFSADLLKPLFARDRPGPTITHLTYSYPSGHATFYAVYFGFIFFLLLRSKALPKWLRNLLLAFCAFLIVSVGLSRLYLGFHWNSDVLGGYLLGVGLLSILIFGQERLSGKSRSAKLGANENLRVPKRKIG
ncbi:MAG: phosphatase PAP2 family protein [bacterium]|nr:phosphatase PAP2 family protein [bacterium]